MPDPIVHHIELCVFNADDTLRRLAKFGFVLYAKRVTSSCLELVARIGSVFFIIKERNGCKPTESLEQKESPDTMRTTLCCETVPHDVDTVFNVAFSCKKSVIQNICERVQSHGGEIIERTTTIQNKDGTLHYAIVKSNCGNVLHTLICKEEYTGQFLPGYDILVDNVDFSNNDLEISGIDHVTLATYSGNSSQIISFYETCFLMNRFEISSNDDVDNGLILSDGVGLRLRAMQFWRCAETGLSYTKNTNSVMLVVVESLEGQINCNVETFLKEHRQPGVEHIALRTKSIVNTVSELTKNGVIFRNPPRAYYDDLQKTQKLEGLSENLKMLSMLGILLDNETDPKSHTDENGSASNEKKYLMQIFAHPLFDLKTFFIEIIQRSGAKGLGSGNILALVKSIREEERRNAMKSEAKKQEITKESITSPRQC